MIRRAFPAEVTNGQLRFHTSLQDLEGRRVMVELNECESPSSQWPILTPEVSLDDVSDLDQNVEFQRPFQREALRFMVNDAGKLKPTVILPGEGFDD